MENKSGDCYNNSSLFRSHVPGGRALAGIDNACFKDYLMDSGSGSHDRICYPYPGATRLPQFSMLDPSICGDDHLPGIGNGNFGSSNHHFSDTPPLLINSMTQEFNTSNYHHQLNGAISSRPSHYNNNNNTLSSCTNFEGSGTNSPLNAHSPFSSHNPLMPDSSLSFSMIGPQQHQAINDKMSAYSNQLDSFGRSEPLSDAEILVSTTSNEGVTDPASVSSSTIYTMSPLFGGTETAPSNTPKMDSDPFSPSISSSASSILSVELPLDKSSGYVSGSVDSGVVVNGSSSSPFSTTDSNRNGDGSSINDSLISPLTQPGSERSIETTPGSHNSMSSEFCSPRVDFEMMSLDINSSGGGADEECIGTKQEKSKTRAKEKSHKGRKRKPGSDGQKKSKSYKSKKQSSSSSSTALMPTYQSEISPGQNGGIKLKISLTPSAGPISSSMGKRRRKHQKKSSIPEDEEPSEQTRWGLPPLTTKILTRIFHHVTEYDGCLPSLFRLSQVCRLWREAALTPELWYNIDLSNKWCSKNPAINDYNFTWFCDKRLSKVQELGLGGWTFVNTPLVLDKIARNCKKLSGINLTGWANLNADNIRFLVTKCFNLQRVNLSGISSIQSSNNKTGVALSSLLFIASEIGERLTHLVLSDNKLVNIPQIIIALATHCPNLEVLDLSNVRTLASTGQIHVEKLQEGCPKLRILRITNSQLQLTPVPLMQQIASPGFPQLEELSVACSTYSQSSLAQPLVNDEAIERILKASTKLKLLDARNCSKLTDSSLVRVPAWDLTHLYLSGSYVTKTNDSGLDLISQKWSHSLLEVDFAWSTATKSLDAAVSSLAEQAECSKLRILDLTGSSINLPPVQAVLKKCPNLTSLNLSSCRALPRGMKRLYEGNALDELRTCTRRESFDS